ncbi:MAG: DUF6787 family protein [Balneolaceae bacterium]|nr:DUF6787 family protein [Balneolaceae bacterium]
MNRLLDKLMKRWEVESLWQVGVILVVFALTGMTTLYVNEWLFGLLGISDEDPFWLRTLFWLLLVLPAYQVLFLAYGFLLGQFRFVWRFEKKSFRKLTSLFTGRRRDEQ